MKKQTSLLLVVLLFSQQFIQASKKKNQDPSLMTWAMSAVILSTMMPRVVGQIPLNAEIKYYTDSDSIQYTWPKSFFCTKGPAGEANVTAQTVMALDYEGQDVGGPGYYYKVEKDNGENVGRTYHKDIKSQLKAESEYLVRNPSECHPSFVAMDDLGKCVLWRFIEDQERFSKEFGCSDNASRDGLFFAKYLYRSGHVTQDLFTHKMNGVFCKNHDPMEKEFVTKARKEYKESKMQVAKRYQKAQFFASKKNRTKGSSMRRNKNGNWR